MAASWPGGRTAYACPRAATASPTLATGAPVAEPLDETNDRASAEAIRAEPPAVEPVMTEQPSTPRHGWLRRHWQLVVVVAMLALAYLTLRDHLPSIHSIGTALSSANVRWIIVAAACEALSLSMFAWQQRSLLGATGVPMSFRRATAVTYARSALAISMPAGSAVSAGFAFQQYRRAGATNDRAAAVTVLSGVVSFLGLASLYVAGILVLLSAEPSETIRNHPVLVAALGAAVALGLIAWLIRRRVTAGRTPKPAVAAPEGSSWRERSIATARQALAAWRALRTRDWMVACSFAVANWLFDLLCLVSAGKAFALPVGLFTIATMYLGIQIVRQLPITPGGIGLIETGLLAGLTHAGATGGTAAAVVLTYRLLSCWLIIPLGGVAWLGLRARTPVDAEAVK
ncbi:MAG TPA: YbhN family protein [Micromonosporaceae bacterium]